MGRSGMLQETEYQQREPGQLGEYDTRVQYNSCAYSSNTHRTIYCGMRSRVFLADK